VRWLRDIDRWFMAEVLPHTAAYRPRGCAVRRTPTI